MSRYTLVEITPDLPLDLFDRLVYGAYQSSHAGPVVLWLRGGLTVDDVRPVLDGAVRALGTGFAGVEFCTEGDPAAPLGIAEAASLCVLSTGACVPFVNPAATKLVSVSEALTALEVQQCFCDACLTHRPFVAA